jgi:hypothetical protein
LLVDRDEQAVGVDEHQTRPWTFEQVTVVRMLNA